MSAMAKWIKLRLCIQKPTVLMPKEHLWSHGNGRYKNLLVREMMHTQHLPLGALLCALGCNAVYSVHYDFKMLV